MVSRKRIHAAAETVVQVKRTLYSSSLCTITQRVAYHSHARLQLFTPYGMLLLFRLPCAGCCCAA
jgi:hypothetical protein